MRVDGIICMARSFMLTLMLSVPLFAWAGAPKQLNIRVGDTTTLSMPAPVSAVKVDDPNVVTIKREGRKVSLEGLSKGTTDVVVSTSDGDVHFHVYVAADRYSMP